MQLQWVVIQTGYLKSKRVDTTVMCDKQKPGNVAVVTTVGTTEPSGDIARSFKSVYFKPLRTMRMRCLTVVTLFCQFYYSIAEFTFVTRTPSRPLCENPNKNVLIEHFFNTIFTEFYSTPPVCVCVQMCAGQSTYCYPNGCLKSAGNDAEVKAATTQYPIIQKNKNHFMLLKGDRDFMTEFLEQNYGNELRESPQLHNPVDEMKPDSFKKKYSVVGKYNTAANVNLRPNIRVQYDKVKKEVLKTENVDFTKTRWPLNTQKWSNGRRSFSSIEKPRSQGAYFSAMLQENDIPGYPPKYFKRELSQTLEDDDGNTKQLNHLGNSLNETDSKSFSLETLIDHLIRSSFGTNTEITPTVTIAKRDETKVPSGRVLRENSTGLANETTSVISMNFTNENVDKNKYLDTSQMKTTTNLKDMISILANRIEIENNTSMEIAKRTIKGFNEEELKVSNDGESQLNTTIETTDRSSTSNYYVTVTNEILTPESTVATVTTNKIELVAEISTIPEVTVTKKNRQKVVKKASSKMNIPDINLKF